MDYSPKLKMWYYESLNETGIIKRAILKLQERLNGGVPKNYAVFPKSSYERISEFYCRKEYDYCFIGSLKIDAATYRNRKWILEFVAESFTNESYLQFTDRITKADHKILGQFDYTFKRVGFVPKEEQKENRNRFDENYYRTMSKSKFTLCPAGDAPWSIRFYEALMCKSIPIVNRKLETYRTASEALIGYKFYLTHENHEFRKDWVEHNYDLFIKYHTLSNDSLF